MDSQINISFPSRQAVQVDVNERPFDPGQQKARIYVWPAGEDIVQNLQERRRRPYTEWRKQIVWPVVVAMGFVGKPSDLAWSQKAGCRCGCSPGFIDRTGTIRSDLHIHARIAS
jgi:hypothetical protein